MHEFIHNEIGFVQGQTSNDQATGSQYNHIAMHTLEDVAFAKEWDDYLNQCDYRQKDQTFDYVFFTLFVRYVWHL